MLVNLKRRMSVSAAIRQQVGSAADASSESPVRQSALRYLQNDGKGIEVAESNGKMGAEN